MLFSYCWARSIDEVGDFVETPVELLSLATSDTKSVDEVAENPAQM